MIRAFHIYVQMWGRDWKTYTNNFTDDGKRRSYTYRKCEKVVAKKVCLDGRLENRRIPRLSRNDTKGDV